MKNSMLLRYNVRHICLLLTDIRPFDLDLRSIPQLTMR